MWSINDTITRRINDGLLLSLRDFIAAFVVIVLFFLDKAKYAMFNNGNEIVYKTRKTRNNYQTVEVSVLFRISAFLFLFLKNTHNLIWLIIMKRTNW